MPSKVIVNIDETGVYFDTPPTRILCERGAPSNITTSQKHSAQLRAVVFPGRQLPHLFIVRGERDDTIALEEVPTYPKVMFGLRIYVP
ncbi:hypothetical protein PPTG_22503 [Phytophthora nicotianae INRA-310]|uniref:DDE-1 domain-containing protein n=1 Tax=Phytophthora nicotianae (strain INRA-310) TaxID=761204 RepID=W2QJY1_PHYN3|nr:hypothetical protein PPTG_22503 [Phytophthora nicotianae INRA-310]ETN12565.1 hypothetical protein PPTG_22503 [Phytophthora nicotianae INRA-310]